MYETYGCMLIVKIQQHGIFDPMSTHMTPVQDEIYLKESMHTHASKTATIETGSIMENIPIFL